MSNINGNLKSVKIPAAPADGVLLLADFAAPQATSVFGATMSVDDVDQFSAISGEAAASAPTGDEFWDNPNAARFRPYIVRDGVLTVPIKGVLLSDFSVAWGNWATGYEYIARAVARGAEDGNVRVIVLDVDSPGGHVKGCSECAEAITKAGKAKPVIAYAETAASAAYWLASCAKEINVAVTGQVGSIGVITGHFDYSKALDSLGIRFTPIFAGERKADGNPYSPLSEEARASIQKRINSLYAIFISAVAEGRGMEEKAVRDTQAEVYGAAQAVKLGLADAVMSRADFSPLDAAAPAGIGDDNDNHDDEASMMQKADAKTYDEGVTHALARAQEIMGMDEAAGREDLAKTLAFDASISVDQAKRILGAAPKAAKTEADGQGAGADFAALMAATGSPKVGPSDEASAKDASDPDGQAALILSMLK